jgi:hypothetical protein
MSDLITIGSHLITPRICYTHHGIYIGQNRVIHLTSKSKVEEVSLSEFTDGNGYSIQSFRSKFSRYEIIDRALSRLGNDNYNVIFNNCEHFCHWCINDENRSQQVNNAALTTSTGLAVAQASTVTTATGLVTASALTSSVTLLSATPVLPAAIVGFGVFKLVQWLSD